MSSPSLSSSSPASPGSHQELSVRTPPPQHVPRIAVEPPSTVGSTCSQASSATAVSSSSVASAATLVPSRLPSRPLGVLAGPRRPLTLVQVPDYLARRPVTLAQQQLARTRTVDVPLADRSRAPVPLDHETVVAILASTRHRIQKLRRPGDSMDVPGDWRHVRRPLASRSPYHDRDIDALLLQAASTLIQDPKGSDGWNEKRRAIRANLCFSDFTPPLVKPEPASVFAELITPVSPGESSLANEVQYLITVTCLITLARYMWPVWPGPQPDNLIDPAVVAVVQSAARICYRLHRSLPDPAGRRRYCRGEVVTLGGSRS